MRERGRSSAAPEQDETTRERRHDGEGVQEDDRERLDLRDAEAHEDLLLRTLARVTALASGSGSTPT
jgi:hypothetical protein